ncbi:MAG: T9SS type A sorting domain-containing protein [Bacteroidota bacterium]|jgi:PKD repeat protein
MMKKLLYFIIVLLSIVTLTNAQCTIDSTQTAAGIYPDSFPNATVGQYYTQDVTFVMLTDTMGLTINNYNLVAITGLPIGLSWQCNNASNGCNYDPSVSLYGCVNLSGTPLIAGTYSMNVVILADIQFLGPQTINFTRPLIVLPNNVSNPGFAMSNSSGCAPLTVNFSNNNPGQSGYAWDFGNGLQSNLENPPSITYNIPGTYLVNQTVTPQVTPQYFLTDIDIISIPNNYGAPVDDPDIYFVIYDSSGTQVYDSRPAIANSFPPIHWVLPNIPLDSQNYSIQVWDEDGGLFGADDDLGNTSFFGHATSGAASGTVNGASGQLQLNYTIYKTPIVPLIAVDTVYVYPVPDSVSILPTGPISVCAGTAVVLTASDSINQLQWYQDSLFLINQTLQSYTPIISGNYSVVATNTYGCTQSATANVSIYPNPPKPNFSINGNIFITFLTGVSYQWYFNGNAINGAINNLYTANQSGTYKLCVTDSNGCSNCSDSLVFNFTGISSNNLSEFMNVYPNPNDGTFQIKLNSFIAEDVVQIINTLGQIVYEEKISNTNQITIQSELEQGVYYLRLPNNYIGQSLKIVVR